ncbi:PaaI family thioesterase [Pseudomonas sp. 10B1]|uniref:PaaI family thioesterase n=1 Tax=unclassified Pseudomonas TaxID=196821 RepID=UPI002AB37E19|nr:MULTISPECIES: PaaI family thioesterase [unclassified Pseudomonas]MDY7560073.1 PaaI family thioesterase [Pseudomonas sp. AB6]MEA9975760.1 PaaI family thioesterase [Pseudomonas sp. RTS4]MEA9995774.1 PaaI family thioesterase [Pseudomonas sp. AA4]MEB0085567.1 PaaI family thioesterase [Pseudomonas sp. RTI1]MEB0124629.1 PaaI family thioesterase [Pseudomonas sp. CCC1.2]
MSENSIFDIAVQFVSVLRHCQVLGMRVHTANADGMTLILPYSEQIVGNPETGAIHGGALTSLMDSTCAIAILCVLPKFEVCPTLDLRIDYMHSAQPHKDVYGFAQCYRVTSDVIFTRGFAYQDDPQRPIAHVVGTFMRMGKSVNGAIQLSDPQRA